MTSCPNEYMKLWDFNTGKYIREVGSPNDYTYFINSWYYKKEYYIVNATNSNVRMYKIKQPKELQWPLQAVVHGFLLQVLCIYKEQMQ